MKEYYEIFNPTAHIMDLFARTKNGVLLVKHYFDNMEEYTVEHFMDWNEEDAKVVAQELERLLCQLDRIGQKMNQLEEHPDQIDVLLTPEEQETYRIFGRPVRGFDVPTSEMLEIFDKEGDVDDPLTPEEEKTLDRYYAWYADECAERLAAKNAPSQYLINRATRYTRLVALKAPQIIINAEAARLADELALYNHTAAGSYSCRRCGKAYRCLNGETHSCPTCD